MRSLRFICVFLLISVYDCALSQTLKVMTYNVRFDNPGDGINSWPNRKQKVYDLLKKYDPDILGVQEALEHQIKDIIQALPEYEYIGVGRDDGKSKGEFSAILFKKQIFSVAKKNTFWLSQTPEVPGSKDWDAAITRIVTWGKFKHLPSGREFYAVNTHFDHIGTEARRNSAVIIKKEIGKMNDAPVIVTGDFNCTRNDPPYQVMIAKEGIPLTDPAPQNAPGTFCNFGVNSMECKPIDYIFHSNQWTASDYKVITDNDGKNYPSDHLPVALTLQLTK